MEIEGRTASSRQGCFGPRSSFYLNGMAHSGRKAGGTVTFWFMNMAEKIALSGAYKIITREVKRSTGMRVGGF